MDHSALAAGDLLRALIVGPPSRGLRAAGQRIRACVARAERVWRSSGPAERTRAIEGVEGTVRCSAFLGQGICS